MNAPRRSGDDQHGGDTFTRGKGQEAGRDLRRWAPAPWAWILVLTLLPGVVSAQQPGVPPTPTELSLVEAIQLAHEFNPEFRIQASSLETLDWERREMWANFIPSASASNSFGYTAEGVRRFGDVSLATQPARYSSGYNIGLSLSLNGSTFLQPRLQRAREQALQADLAGAEAGLVELVTAVYLDVLRTQEEREQAAEELERTSAYVREAEARVEVGAGTPLDIRRAEVQQGQAQVQLLQAENAAATARLTLARTLGVTVPPDVELSTRFELFEPRLDLQELIRIGEERNPLLRAARSREAGARVERRAAQTQYLPSLSLSAGWSGSVFQAGNTAPLVNDRLGQLESQFASCQEENRILALLGDPPRNCAGFDPGDPGVVDQARQQINAQNQGFPFSYESQPLSLSMNVSLPLFTGFSRQLQVEQARVAEGNVRQEVRGAELSLRSDLESAVRAVNTARRTVDFLVQIRETASEELRLAQERFRLGLASSIEVVEAQSGLSEAERNQINGVYDFHLSFAALEALVGVSLRDS